MILVFDMDDTLYDEWSFVNSGLIAVARYIEEYFMIPFNISSAFISDRMQYGRDHILDDILRYFHIYSKDSVRKCLSVYRRHKPDIQLYHVADNCLNNFRQFPKYIVTDGNKLVQHNKVLAMGLYDRVDFVYITHRYGLEHAKPSPYCFCKICQRENVSADEVVYIADNPNKDFVGIKPFGFKTIRVLQGPYKNLMKPPEFEADYNINTLADLDEEFLYDVFNSGKKNNGTTD